MSKARRNLLTERDLKLFVAQRDHDPIELGRRDGSAAESWRPPILQRRDAAVPLLDCVVPGVALGKPRMTRRDKWKQRPSVVAYRAWCDQLRAALGWLDKRTLSTPVKVRLVIALPMPASWSETKRRAQLFHAHTGKPDIDNLTKGILDALFINDALVAGLEVEKIWSTTPQVRLVVEEFV